MVSDVFVQYPMREGVKKGGPKTLVLDHIRGQKPQNPGFPGPRDPGSRSRPLLTPTPHPFLDPHMTTVLGVGGGVLPNAKV